MEDLLDNFKIIPFTNKGDKVKASTLNKKIGEFVYSLMKELEKRNKRSNMLCYQYSSSRPAKNNRRAYQSDGEEAF